MENSAKKDKFFTRNIFGLSVVLIIIFGIFTRIKFYLSGIPLWLDEIMLGYNLTDTNFFDMFQPLEAYQKAPPLFMTSAMLLRKLFGLNEFSLRFIPCICSVLSLPLFYVLLKQNIKSKIGILTGLCMFSFCVPLVYFAGEFKPYGSDVFFCILLLCLRKYFDLNSLSLKRAFVYAFLSAIFIFFSFTTIFIIPAIVFAECFNKKKFDFKVLLIFAGIVFAGLYLYFSDVNTCEYMSNYWDLTESGFGGFSALKLFIGNVLFDFSNYFAHNFTASSKDFLPLILTGYYLLFCDKKDSAALMLLMTFFGIYAALLHIYPLKPKLSMYFLPIYLMIISKCFDLSFFLKGTKERTFFNVALSLYFVYLCGINLPYLNVTEQDIIYYNKNSFGQNKSIENRKLTSDTNLEILKSYKPGEKILASEEFLYGLKYYKFSENFENMPEIYTYDFYPGNSSKNAMKIFIKDNVHKTPVIFVGRNEEDYFTCAESEEIEDVLKSLDIKYEKYLKDGLYMFKSSPH